MTRSSVRRIVHVAETELDIRSGMGRVAFHWKCAFERQNIEFIHFGPKRVGRSLHKALWHRAALKAVVKANLGPDLILAHEPVSFAFKENHFRTVVFSHMPERRGADVIVPLSSPSKPWRVASIKRMLTRYLWARRQRQCDLGLRHCDAVLVSNSSDAAYVRSFYGRREDDMYEFRNGVYPVATVPPGGEKSERNILFYASWVPRKGIATLMDAVVLLRRQGVALRVIACTGNNSGETLEGWPEGMEDALEVVPGIERTGEEQLFASAAIFVLPSLLEGQPLALLQAMAFGRCCIVSAIPGHVDFIENGRTGFLFPPGDASGLASRLRECLESPQLCRNVGKAAAESMKERSWERVTDELASWVLSR